jgi:hypothetical protein
MGSSGCRRSGSRFGWRVGRDIRRNRRNGCDEAIAHSGDCLDKTRFGRIVVQEVAKLSNGGIDAVFGIYEDFTRPQALGDLGAGYQLSFARDQEDEEFHGLAFDA